jgi:hypothetical protein
MSSAVVRARAARVVSRPVMAFLVRPARRYTEFPGRVRRPSHDLIHNFQDDEFGQGGFPVARELQDVANPIEGCPHCFDMFGVQVKLRKWHGRTHGKFTFSSDSNVDGAHCGSIIVRHSISRCSL